MSINPSYDNFNIKYAALVVSVSMFFIALIGGAIYFFSKDNFVACFTISNIISL